MFLIPKTRRDHARVYLRELWGVAKFIFPCAGLVVGSLAFWIGVAYAGYRLIF